jgi:serine/threonine protein kinase
MFLNNFEFSKNVRSVGSCIGNGVLGVVYRGVYENYLQNETLTKDVAIKVLHPKFWNDPEGIKRFEQEAEKNWLFNYDTKNFNVVKVIEIGNSNIKDKSLDYQYTFPYMVLPLYKGTLFNRRYELNNKQKLKCLADIVNGLAGVLEKHNIFHGDIHPDNIFFDGENFIVGDFGFANLFETESPKKVLERDYYIVKSHEILPHHFFPEPEWNFNFQETDVYGVGATLIYLFMDPLFLNDAILKDRKEENMKMLREEFMKTIPEEYKFLEEIINRSFTTNKKEIYSNVIELKKHLDTKLKEQELDKLLSLNNEIRIGKKKYQIIEYMIKEKVEIINKNEKPRIEEGNLITDKKYLIDEKISKIDEKISTDKEDKSDKNEMKIITPNSPSEKEKNECETDTNRIYGLLFVNNKKIENTINYFIFIDCFKIVKMLEIKKVPNINILFNNKKEIYFSEFIPSYLTNKIKSLLENKEFERKERVTSFCEFKDQILDAGFYGIYNTLKNKCLIKKNQMETHKTYGIFSLSVFNNNLYAFVEHYSPSSVGIVKLIGDPTQDLEFGEEILHFNKRMLVDGSGFFLPNGKYLHNIFTNNLALDSKKLSETIKEDTINYKINSITLLTADDPKNTEIIYSDVQGNVFYAKLNSNDHIVVNKKNLTKLYGIQGYDFSPVKSKEMHEQLVEKGKERSLYLY